LVCESLWGNIVAVARATAGDVGAEGAGVSASARAMAGDVGAGGAGGASASAELCRGTWGVV